MTRQVHDDQGDLLAALDILGSAGMLPADPPPAAAPRKAPRERPTIDPPAEAPAVDITDAAAIRARWDRDLAAARAKFDHPTPEGTTTP